MVAGGTGQKNSRCYWISQKWQLDHLALCREVSYTRMSQRQMCKSITWASSYTAHSDAEAPGRGPGVCILNKLPGADGGQQTTLGVAEHQKTRPHWRPDQPITEEEVHSSRRGDVKTGQTTEQTTPFLSILKR